MKLLQQEKENNPRKKLTKLLKIGVVFFLLIFFLEVWMVNRLSTYGDKIQTLQEAKVALLLENQVMETMIAQKSSLFQIEIEANKLGFAPIRNLEYFKPVALASLQ